MAVERIIPIVTVEDTNKLIFIGKKKKRKLIYINI